MKQHFQVSGMTCGHCEKAVTRAVKDIDPHAEVVVDRSQETVDITSEQPRLALSQAITEAGYTVRE
jgi:copper chaperone